LLQADWLGSPTILIKKTVKTQWFPAVGAGLSERPCMQNVLAENRRKTGYAG